MNLVHLCLVISGDMSLELLFGVSSVASNTADTYISSKIVIFVAE